MKWLPRVRRQHIRSSLAALAAVKSTPRDEGTIATIRTIFRNALAKQWPPIMDRSVAEDLNHKLSQADTICRRAGVPTRVAA
ncbi:MAG: hypothetical protein E6R03_18160 [Hyphomicrobiaceae bacterium]|nr:MAG: hypothetical protein E6R03_18160 [Hyphomicrobiaceae bacterium]